MGWKYSDMYFPYGARIITYLLQYSRLFILAIYNLIVIILSLHIMPTGILTLLKFPTVLVCLEFPFAPVRTPR